MANTCPIEGSEKEMKKQVGCAMLNLREKRGKKMLSNCNKGEKGAGLGLGLNLLLGFRCNRDLFLCIFFAKRNIQ